MFLYDWKNTKHGTAMEIIGEGLQLYNVNCENAEPSLNGFHVVSGNNYVSSLFEKDKSLCWKVAKKNPPFLQAFKLLYVKQYLPTAAYKILHDNI